MISAFNFQLPLAAKEKKQAPLLIDLTEDEESL